MDLIKISDSKLKIMLTPSDMTYYDLHNDSVSFADAHVRRVLRRLLSDAREQTGFDGDMTRLYVQMYPCADGGCELFISKPEEAEGPSDAFASAPMLPSPTIKSRALRGKERHGPDMCAYSFTSLGDVISICRRLCAVGFPGKSTLYVDQKNVYFLLLRDVSPPSLYSPDEYCFLGEYGTRENARVLQTYICEYGMLICEDDAVQTLSQL